MGKKVHKSYLALSHAIADLGKEPQCADPTYMDFFFVDVMPTGMPTSAAMRKMRQDEIDAKIICDFCPVKTLCAEYAILAREPYGIWGATTPAERTAINKLRN